MALYVYKKAPPQLVTATSQPRSLTGRLKRLAPTALITLGSLLIANVGWPILQYQLFISPSLKRAELITPVSISQTAFINPSANVGGLQPPQALSSTMDYTKASNWFPSAPSSTPQTSKITHYTILIPKVDIQDAIVEIGGEDLSDHIIQYPGTALPGQLGSPVLFGHSVLRQFYDPRIENPRRYVSIFSKIMTLKNGDEIFVDFDGIRYRYVIREKFEVKPEDIYILQQRYNSRDLKLVTCVPEGTYLRRGVVVAQLEQINPDDLPSDSP